MHRNEIRTGAAPAKFKIALLGNPNSGKSSIFNQLTGLRQKVGNFPGVTVDKKTGELLFDNGSLPALLIDFPGTYSLYPHSEDERIVVQTFVNPADPNYPDAVIYVADLTRLEKHLLLFTQLKDLGLPLILALNMVDLAEKEGLEVNIEQLEKGLQCPVIAISARTGQGMDKLKATLAQWAQQQPALSDSSFYRFTPQEEAIIAAVQQHFPHYKAYQALLALHHHSWLSHLSGEERSVLAAIAEQHHFQRLRNQVEETMERYDRFTPIMRQSLRRHEVVPSTITAKLDAVLTHRLAGPFIFFGLMALLFQAIFSWAEMPMNWIEQIFGFLSQQASARLPEGWLSSLITDGLLPGLGGIIVFVPQIAILFFLISLLEEVGYMARAVFLFDRIMQVFGLNGRSVVALISGGACAIPAIMSARTIGHPRERLITILVTPLISCSARIPVYTVLIGFIIPQNLSWGIFNLQGLAFMGLYLLGILATLLSALVFKWILPTRERSFLMLELPEYRAPVMRNIGLTVWEKVKTFVSEAGKVILFMAIILWALASFSLPGRMDAAKAHAAAEASAQQLSAEKAEALSAAYCLEASFAGILGQAIEPAIKPLGFDWKIGIALITSFAAREVFVGTMATIYSLGNTTDEFSVRQQMARERDPRTGRLVYDLATSLSLIIFYVFAMMCMSTLAVVKRETKSWKWPLVQFTFMTTLAYLSSLLVYWIFS